MSEVKGRINTHVPKARKRKKLPNIFFNNLFLKTLPLIPLIIFGFFGDTFAQKDGNTGSSVSAGTNIGTSAAAFLEIGVGAKAQSMGGAFVSLADDPTAMYWNPAGIGRISGFEATFIHVNWLLDTNYDYSGIVTPIGGIFVIGVNVIVF